MIVGGVRTIARCSSVLVPFMGLTYIVLALYICVVNYQLIPGIIELIYTSAFGLTEMGSGALGAAVINGIKRGEGMSRLWKRKDRLAEVILKNNTPIFYTLLQYRNREDKTITSEMWENIENLRLQMDDMDSKEAKDYYMQVAHEIYMESKDNEKIKGRAIWKGL